jgi:transposase
LVVKRFIEGDDRTQNTLFPASLDEYVDEDNPVRVVDAFVDALDLEGLGFRGVVPEATGRPSYHPSVLLKIYVYGYLNRIASSRRLEKETQRNIEMMWLTGRLMPDFKTIANFRKENPKALRGVCREFVVLCRNLDLFSDALVAIDSSKFKAVNNRDRNFTVAKMKRRLEQIEKSIDRYMAAMDTADRQEPEIAKARKARLGEKIEILKEQTKKLKALEGKMLEAEDKQLSLTDPDARSMMTSGRGTGMVGYNVQATVDAKHHLILDHQTTQTGLDNGQLADMATRAKDLIGTDDLTVVADRGYFEGEQIRSCDEAGITTFVPKPLTSGSKAKGRFGKQDFVYLANEDAYRCPAGEKLNRRFWCYQHDKAYQCYATTACPTCHLQAQCTTGPPWRRIRRWEHEAVVEAAQRRLDLDPEKMAVRRCTAEHPFGTLKSWMGATHFLTRTKDRVNAEMSLFVLAYNIKRMIKILGMKPLLEAIRAHGEVLVAFFAADMASIGRSRRLFVAMTVIPTSTTPLGAS